MAYGTYPSFIPPHKRFAVKPCHVCANSPGSVHRLSQWQHSRLQDRLVAQIVLPAVHALSEDQLVELVQLHGHVIDGRETVHYMNHGSDTSHTSEFDSELRVSPACSTWRCGPPSSWRPVPSPHPKAWCTPHEQPPATERDQQSSMVCARDIRYYTTQHSTAQRPI